MRFAGVDNDIPAGECATHPRSSGALPSGCVRACHTTCLTHTGASSRGSRIVWRACLGVRRRIATPGALVIGARRRPLRGRRQRASAGALQRGACARGLQTCRKGRAGLELDFVAVGLARRRRGSRMLRRAPAAVPDAWRSSRALVATRQEGLNCPAVGAAPPPRRQRKWGGPTSG